MSALVEDGGVTAADVLADYVRSQRDRLVEQEQLLRAGDDEGVHQLRVAARRIRSALATYRPILDRETSEPLREELKWFGGVLGPARDTQVQRERLLDLLDGEDELLVLGPVRTRIDDELRARFQDELSSVLEMLDGERYTRLLASLAAAATDLPELAGDAPAAELLPVLLRRDLKRLRRRHRDAELSQLALHEVRKAAKRLRYAAEGASPVLGDRASRLASQAEAVQDLLGELQDTVVSRETLRELGVTAHLAGENGFTFGRLHALEQARAEAVVADYPATYAALPRPRTIARWD